MKINMEQLKKLGPVSIRVTSAESIKYQECVLSAGGMWRDGGESVRTDYEEMEWLDILPNLQPELVLTYSCTNKSSYFEIDPDELFIDNRVINDDYDYAMGIV